MARLIRENRILWPNKQDGRPRLKKFLREAKSLTTGFSSWLDDVGYNTEGTRLIQDLFGEKVFSFAKPLSLMSKLVSQGTSNASGIVMDFFAGSATLAQAVVAANAADSGTRRFVVVQFPEKVIDGQFATIADIAKERIRRAGAKIKTETATTAPDLDVGFRVLKIGTSNMKDVYYAPDAVKQADLLAQLDNIWEDRSPEDLLFQVLVDWGIDLALPIATETLAGKTVFFVNIDDLAACFDPDITDELVKEIAARNPLRAVFRDSSYGSDSVKINVEQIFRLLSPRTEIKSL
jgi:adenine-specific DNA-methyltransferase